MKVVEIRVPNLSGFTDVPIMDVHVEDGEEVGKEDPIISLESEKAVMEVPSPFSGKIIELTVEEGDTVNTGDVIGTMETDEEGAGDAAPVADTPAESAAPAASASAGGTVLQDIVIPNLSGFTDVPIMDVHVEEGDSVETEDPIISLESEKAVMEVPSLFDGKIVELTIEEGDTVNTGDVIGKIEVSASDAQAIPAAAPSSAPASASTSAPASSGGESVQDIVIPNLSGFTDVPIMDVHVEEGDSVETEDPIISLESEKAVMEVPSLFDGEILELTIEEGDTVNTGDVIGKIKVSGGASTASAPAQSSAPAATATPAASASAPASSSKAGVVHATPSLRILAREMGIDLSTIKGTGPFGRITGEDLAKVAKASSGASSAPAQSAAAPASSGAFTLPPIPSADYAAFGSVENKPLTRIQKVSGPHLHKNWVGIPHVTQFEEADITELEAFRKAINAERVAKGKGKVSPLIFIMMAVAKVLKQHPDFNSSLNPDGVSLTRKNYVNLGIAVDTPDGLVVPVIKNADTKGVDELSTELAELSAKAREGKLRPDEMQGATFTISSLGGIGGTYFTPIVNGPEVAILGVSRSAMKPVWNGSEFEPRFMLPLSLSYDNRVIDGAKGARFAVALAGLLSDIRKILL